MKSAFDANVPKRKPRTRLGTMLAELDAPAEDAPVAAEAASAAAEAAPENEPAEARAPEAEAGDRDKRPARAKVTAAPEREAVAEPKAPQNSVKSSPKARAAQPAAKVSPPRVEPAPKSVATAREPSARKAAAESTRPRVIAPAEETVLTGRARIAELRERLAQAAKRRETPPAEPTVTADRVRETVSSLSTRVAQAAEEKKALLEALESARAELADTNAALDRERTGRTDAEQLAEERAKVADELMAESEALADERDRALARIGELEVLDREQAGLLEEMEATLGEREEAAAELTRRNAELRGALDASAVDLDLAEKRLEEQTAETGRLAARVDQLELELARARSAREALSEIQRLVDGLDEAPAARPS